MKKFLFLLFICFFSFPATPALAEKQPINDVYVVIFIMDGTNYEVFYEAVNEGLAPNIKKYFIEGGAEFTGAISVFPSASPNAYLSFASGLFSGFSGTQYLGWFNRSLKKPVGYFSLSGLKHLDNELININALLDPNVSELYPPSTIFDHLKGHETAAIYSFHSRGAKSKKPANPIPALWSTFGSGREEMLDMYAYKGVMQFFKKNPEEIPRFTMAGLYGFDSHGHHYGAKSDIVKYNIELFDGFLSNFFDLLKEKGIYEKTYVVISADHGMHDTPKGKFDLETAIRDMGLVNFSGKSKRNNFDVYVEDRGIGSAHIYVKGDSGWNERPCYERLRNYALTGGKQLDIIEQLISRPEIRFILARDGHHNVHAFSKSGHAKISYNILKKPNLYKYAVVDGDDPLEIKASTAANLVNKGYYDATIWGEKTFDHKYPDAVVQLAQVFADGRSGDIYVIAEPEWVFYRAKKATHGTIYRDDMHVPLLMRGPTVEKTKFGFMRIGDLYPTMLGWYGIKDNGLHNGVSPFGSNQLEKSRTPDIRALEIKLDGFRENLLLQKSAPKKYSFTPNIALDANLWLINEQIKRTREYAEIFLQQRK